MKKLQFTAMLFALFAVGQLQAQITTTSYLLFNGQSCDVTVSYQVVNANCVPTSCNSTNLVISAGTGVTLSCANPGDDISFTLTEMDYIPISGVGTVSTPSGCLAFPTMNSTTPSATEIAALNAAGCGTPTGNCTIICTGTYAKVGY